MEFLKGFVEGTFVVSKFVVFAFALHASCLSAKGDCWFGSKLNRHIRGPSVSRNPCRMRLLCLSNTFTSVFEKVTVHPASQNRPMLRRLFSNSWSGRVV